MANYDLLANRLKKTQLVLEDPSGRSLDTFTYADLVTKTEAYLGFPARPHLDGFADLGAMLSELMILTEPPAAARSRAPTLDARR